MGVIELADYKCQMTPLRIVFEGGLAACDFERASRALASRLKVGSWMLSKGQCPEGQTAWYMEFEDNPSYVRSVVQEIFQSAHGYHIDDSPKRVRDIEGIERVAIAVKCPAPEGP